MTFHLAVAAFWSLVILFRARDDRLGSAATLRTAAVAFIVAFALSYGAAQVFPDNTECTEQTPTGRGIC